MGTQLPDQGSAGIPCSGRGSLNPWTAREFPVVLASCCSIVLTV